ncbi:MAG TPA: HEAT repeat domain-containing protein, partial [Planctomycetota bacterium]
MIFLLILLQDAARLEQEIEYANSKDKPQMHATAAKRLAARGGPAVAEAVEAFIAKHGHNSLSLAFTETLGDLKDPRLTARLRALAADPNFFWRPAAMRALAKHADPGSADVVRAALSDKLWGVRVGAIQGVERLKDRASLPRVKELLGDEQYDVRAQAAKTLRAFDDPSGLPVLVEALRADTVWFDIDYGQIAREDAWNFLKTLTGDDFGYKPWDGAEARAPGLAKFEAWIARTIPDWRDRLPEKARVRAEKVEYVFGYELRSCQRGDVFFRLDAEGNLVLGYFNLEKAKLAPDELKALLAEVEKVKKVDRSQPYGEGGCDYEQFYLKAGPRFEKLWIGQRGRPEGVEAFVKFTAGLLKAKF